MTRLRNAARRITGTQLQAASFFGVVLGFALSLALPAYAGTNNVDQGQPGNQGGWHVVPSAEYQGLMGQVLCNGYTDGGATVIPQIVGQIAVAFQNMSPCTTTIGYSEAILTSPVGWTLNASSGSSPTLSPGGAPAVDQQSGTPLTMFCVAASGCTQVDGGGLNYWIVK